MKKIFVLFVLAISFSAAHAFIGNDKVINKNQLPAQAQSFLNENFANVKISYAKLETDFLVSSYEVMLADGTKLEFSNKGNWEEVDCRQSAVPAAIVPQPIKDYVDKNYAGERIVIIEKNRKDYEVKLSNRLELKFDKNFNIYDIDD